METNHKFAVPLAGGMVVEAVYYASGTLCVSSQAGCALGCPFCASGSRGLQRNLALEEMQRQLVVAIDQGVEPKRVTISGIGEPLHNPQPVRQFMEYCMQRGLPVSLTTTASPLPQLSEFLGLAHNGLMISVHAGTAETHRRLIPRGPDFSSLINLLQKQVPVLSRRRRRKLGINYLLLEGINDSACELKSFAESFHGLQDVTVHLLTCNPVPGSPYSSPPQQAIDKAYRLLTDAGLQVRRANRWRRQTRGGCGTLFVAKSKAGC